MLHFNTTRRLSIDVDVICPPGTIIEDYLGRFAKEYGFGEIRLENRIAATDVPKTHAKFFYSVAYPAFGGEDKILLDVLFEENHYSNVVSLPIQSPFLKTEGSPVLVSLPSVEDLLGDKLTAFAPHTIGIPFYKKGRDCAMEIIKQLFDISSLFDVATDLFTTAKTFRRFVDIEAHYRSLSSIGVSEVLADIYATALCICLRGQKAPDEFTLLQNGIKRVRPFIYSVGYDIDKAIVDASKVAYLCELIRKDALHGFNRFSLADSKSLASATLADPIPPKLNKLKKNNVEAFFYWNEIQKTMQDGF